MINIFRGNFFEIECDAIVIPVNCVGVMGAGLAKKSKEYFPANFVKYRSACLTGKLKIGDVKMFYTFEENKYIFNFPTKNEWKYNSEIEFINLGMDSFISTLIELYLSIDKLGFVVNIPALGCGLGGLYWETEVKPLLLRKLEILSKDFTFNLFEPTGFLN